jgi:hypothetical protein
MQTRLLKKLAGYIAIELLCVVAASAADYEFNAGYVELGRVRALALEDVRGQRAVIATAAFSVPLSVADTIAAQVIKQFNIERSSLLIYSVATGDPNPDEARNAIGAALGDLKPAVLEYGNGRLTVTAHDGKCRVALTPEASMTSCSTPVGDLVSGRIRSAYRMVDQMHGLQTRDQTPQSVAIQAIALGNSILFFAGPKNAARPGKGMILALGPAVEEDPRLSGAVGEVFLRVGRR